MTISSYLCHVVGELPARTSRLHASTIQRTKAFAIAIHIPVILWAVTGYVIASQIFKRNDVQSAAIAFFCAAMIYLVERLVLATPKAWYLSLGRVLIGCVIAVLGASTVDLVIFDREVTQQLREDGELRIRAEHDKAAPALRQALAQRKADWLEAQDAANCEANGTCGSKVRSVGPVYRELSRQASLLRSDYMAAQARLQQLDAQRDAALAQWRSAPQALEQAGLLARVQALHQYTTQNTAAFVAWALFFILVLSFELMVVLAKLVFSETVDDALEEMREDISKAKAIAYVDALRSPFAAIRVAIEEARTT